MNKQWMRLWSTDRPECLPCTNRKRFGSQEASTLDTPEDQPPGEEKLCTLCIVVYRCVTVLLCKLRFRSRDIHEGVPVDLQEIGKEQAHQSRADEEETLQDHSRRTSSLLLAISIAQVAAVSWVVSNSKSS